MPLAALMGCGRSHVNIEAPGISIHTQSDGVSINGHITGDEPSIKATGPVTDDNRTVEEFHGVDADSVVQVKFVKGAERKVTVSARQSILGNVETKVENGILHVGLRGNVDDSGEITVSITNPALDQVDLSGATIGSFSGLDEPNLKVTVDGGSKVAVDGSVEKLQLELGGSARLVAKLTGHTELDGKSDGSSMANVSGSFTNATLELDGSSQLTLEGLQSAETKITADSGSHIQASGTTEALDLNLEGSANAELAELTVGQCKVQADGGSMARLNVTRSLAATLSGGSNVTYAGNPAVTQSVDGGASLHRE